MQQKSSIQKSREMIIFSQQIISSLKDRINELEMDTIIENQDNEKLQSEIQQLKRKLLKLELRELERMMREIDFMLQMTELNHQEEVNK
jgi:hypothetical protein